MNLFVTDENPKISAQNLDDKRMVKMCLETTQLLCSAINYHGGKSPYKSTHLNHPVSVWVRQSQLNAQWAKSHGLALCYQYSKRYGKFHKCENILRSLDLYCLPIDRFTPFVNCAANESLGINFKHIQDPIEAYRRYLISRWNTDKLKPTWDIQDYDSVLTWLAVDNSGKFLYKDENYNVLFGGPHEKQTKPIGIIGDYQSTIL